MTAGRSCGRCWHTADGVLLKGTAWARLLGTTEPVIKHRYRRLTRLSSDEIAGQGVACERPTSSEEGSVRSAKPAIRKHPELADELTADPEVEEIIRKRQEARDLEVIEQATAPTGYQGDARRASPGKRGTRRPRTTGAAELAHVAIDVPLYTGHR